LSSYCLPRALPIAMLSAQRQGPWAPRGTLLYQYTPPALLLPAQSPSAVASFASASPSQKTPQQARPLSPSVSIYKLPIPAYSSISNRIVTVGLAGAFALLAFLRPDQDQISDFVDRHPISGGLIRGALSFAGVYHFLHSARHKLQWDHLKGITIPAANRSSQVLFAVSAITGVFGMLKRGAPRELNSKEVAVVQKAQPKSADAQPLDMQELEKTFNNLVHFLNSSPQERQANLLPILRQLRKL